MVIKSLRDLIYIVNSVKGAAKNYENCNLPKCLVKAFNYSFDRIIQKVGEEGVEVVLAATKFAVQPSTSNDNIIDKHVYKEELISECADLLFRLTILLSYFDINIDSVFGELERRFNSKDYCNCHLKK